MHSYVDTFIGHTYTNCICLHKLLSIKVLLLLTFHIETRCICSHFVWLDEIIYMVQRSLLFFSISLDKRIPYPNSLINTIKSCFFTWQVKYYPALKLIHCCTQSYTLSSLSTHKSSACKIWRKSESPKLA